MGNALRMTEEKEPELHEYKLEGYNVPVKMGELWTAKQRQMHPVHYTISYRASFKPELPDFFIRKFAKNRNTVVLDPFGGRGTTILQSNLLGLKGIHNDINPVSGFMATSRQTILPLAELKARTEELNLRARKFRVSKKDQEKLYPFFHPDTLQEILNLRSQLLAGKGKSDPALDYIGVTALSRLYGHSDGFLSVYTFPQISIMPGAQRKNNLNRKQKPEYRNVQERIIRKMKRDLSQEVPEYYHTASAQNQYTSSDARNIPSIDSNSVDLVITSPPFLDKVNYADDNWMRAWFLGINEEDNGEGITMTPDAKVWSDFMEDVMKEMGRVLTKGGRAVIEVGEVKARGRNYNLEELMIDRLPMKLPDGGNLKAEMVYINDQEFTKLANCWDVKNNKKGTNTNRCLVLVKR